MLSWISATFLVQQVADPVAGLLNNSNPLLVAIGVVFAGLMSIDKLAFWLHRRKNGGATNHNDAKRVVECLEGIQHQLQELNTNMAVLLDRNPR